MALMRWEPFKEMMTLRQAMDRLFEDSFVKAPRFWTDGEGGDILLDVYQTPNDVVVKASLPGVKPDEVNISITDDILTIKGEHKEEKEAKDKDYLIKEHRYGSFSRSILIPLSVKSDKAEATFENGILTLTLPKAEEVKPKQIKIKPKAMIEGSKK